MFSVELGNYLFNNPKYRIGIKKRAYDGLYEVYRPYIDVEYVKIASLVGKQPVHSISWETVGVFDNEKDANEFAKKMLSDD